MICLYAFLVGGAICALGQLMMDKLKLMPVHITSIFVFIGSLLSINNIYEKLVNFAGAGASMPISSFGYSLTHAAVEEANSVGYLGILTGMFSLTSTGIISAIVFSFLIALIFSPRG